MDSTILDIIKVHNFLGNKNNLEKSRNMNDKFLRDLNETEGISENNEIYERINRDRCNDEKIDGLVDYLNKNNNRNNETVVEILKGLKISILDFIKSLINIFYYKTELIKRIEVTQIVSEFMKPLKWENMEKYKKLESFFKRLDKGNNNQNREKEEKLETIIFNRATEIFVNQKINNWEKILELEYKKDDNTDICKFVKDISGVFNEFDKVKENIEVKNFKIKPDEVIFRYNETDILEKGEEQKKMFLYFLLILEVTYNINDLKGDFVFFKNISNINELYEGFHIFAKKVIGSLKKDDGKKKGDKGKKKKGDKGKKKKKKQSGGARKKKKSADFSISNKFDQLKKKGDDSKKGKDGKERKDGDKGNNKKVKDKNLEKFDQLTELIKFKKSENNNNVKARSGKSLKKMLEGLKVYQYTMFDYQNDSYLKNEIFKKIKEINNVAKNDPNKFNQKTKNNRENLKKIFCNDGSQGKDTKKTFNIFKPIYSDDTGDYFIGEDDMVNGKIQKLNTFLLPYTDKYGNDVKGYLRRNLNNENIKKIIKNVFNLYSGILFIQLKFLLRMYLRVREQSIVEELIEKDNRLDLMTPEAKKKNKNSKNSNSKNSNFKNGKSNNGNSKNGNSKNGNSKNNSNLNELNENKNLTIKEINKNMLKLQHIKELYNKKKMEIIHNNSYKNENREKALQLINQQVKNIINKLNKLKNGK